MQKKKKSEEFGRTEKVYIYCWILHGTKMENDFIPLIKGMERPFCHIFYIKTCNLNWDQECHIAFLAIRKIM